MIAKTFSLDTLPHQKILIGIYVSMAIFLVAEIIFFWNDAAGALIDYLSSGIVGFLAVGVVYATPLSCFAIAYLLHRKTRTIWLILLAAQTTLVFSFALLPAIYLLWWYWRTRIENDNA